MDDQQSPDLTGQPQLSLGFAPAKTADGQYFVTVMVQYGMIAFQFPLPLDAADEQADAISHNIKEAAAAARRDRSGLVIASNGNPTPHFPKHGRRR
jgi:hypothetical protein